MTDGVYSEVRLDFSGTAVLAANMQAAARATGQLQKNLSQAQRDLQQLNRQFVQSRMPGLPSAGHSSMEASARARALSGPDATRNAAALAGTAAAGSVFFYKATQLANPAATQRFQMAIEDTTAVIGHKMIPALNSMTRGVRAIGDFLANHPTLTTGLGYAGAGLALAATAGTVWNIGKSAAGGLRSMGGTVGSLFGYGADAAGSALGARSGVAGGNRAAQVAAYAQSLQSERAAANRIKLLTAAELATGGYGGSPTNSRELELAKKELAAIKAEQQLARVPGRTALSARAGGMGIGTGSLAVAGSVGNAALAYEDITGNRPIQGAGRLTPLPGVTNSLTNITDFVGKHLTDTIFGSGSWDKGNANLFGGKGGVSSQGSAARPAEYQDVLGSLLDMRQAIASGGTDAAKQTADAAKEQAVTLKEIKALIDEIAKGGDFSKRAGAAPETSTRGTKR